MAIGATIPEHLKKKPIEKPEPNKRKGWRTPYGFIDFKEPVSYEVALSEIEKATKQFEHLWSKNNV